MAWSEPKSLIRFCREVLPLIHENTDGVRALKTVEAIVDTDKWNSFEKFHETTEILAKYYKEASADVEISRLNTGGGVGSGRWVIHEAADVQAARVDVIHPVKERILDYANNPWHVIQWSAATPEGGMESELVIIDSIKELEEVPCGSLSGNTILTCMNPRPCLQLFASTGATAVISDVPVPNLPNATAWTKFGWGGIPVSDAAIHLVGLVLSQNQGAKLRNLSGQSERVLLHTTVDTRRYAGTHDLLSGIVRGTDDEEPELWVLSHDKEPGALDNASGVAACGEISRVIETLIASGTLPRPRRSIRMLHGYECYGFFKYLEDVKRAHIPLAGVVIDTVGSRLDVCNRRLEWHATLPMSAGFVDRVGETMIRRALALSKPGYALFLEPFIATSDTLIGDPQYGFPAPWISTHHKAKNVGSDAYHSSGDTPNLISPEGIATCITAMAGYLYYLADAGSAEIAELVTSETEHSLAQMQAVSKNLLTSTIEKNYIRVRYRENMRQLTRWTSDSAREEARRQLSICEARIDELIVKSDAAQTRRKRQTVAGANLVPQRIMLLTPDTFSNVSADVKSQIELSNIQPWALFWADGERRLDEIAEMISCELGEPVELNQVIEFFKAHAQIGYVEFIERNDCTETS